MKVFLFDAALFIVCYFSLNGIGYAVLSAEFNRDGIEFEDFRLFAYRCKIECVRIDEILSQ